MNHLGTACSRGNQDSEFRTQSSSTGSVRPIDLVRECRPAAQTQGSSHQHKRSDALRVSNGQLLGHVAAAGGAENKCLPHVEGIQDRGGVPGLFRQRIPVRRFVRLTLAPEVGRVNPEASQPGHKAVEASAGFAPGMQQQQRPRVGASPDEARHRDARGEPQIPDLGVHRLRVRLADCVLAVLPGSPLRHRRAVRWPGRIV